MTGRHTVLAQALILAVLSTPPADSQVDDRRPSPPSAQILEGRIPVVDFFRYVQVATGIPVLYDSVRQDSRFDDRTEIEVLGHLKNVTFPLVKEILRTNGFDLARRRLEDGTNVWLVGYADARRTETPPFPTPILTPQDLVQKEPEPEPSTESLAGLSAHAERELLRRYQASVKVLLQVVSKEKGSPVFRFLRLLGEADDELLRAILEVSGYRVVPQFLEGGIEIIHVERPTVSEDSLTKALLVHRPAEATPSDVLTRLRDLLRPNPTETAEEQPVKPRLPGRLEYRETPSALVFRGDPETLRALEKILETNPSDR